MVDAVLRFFEISVRCAWPLIFLLVLYLFRQQLAGLLPELGRRLTKAEVANTKWEFAGALRDAIGKEQRKALDIPEFGVQEAVVNSLSLPILELGSAYKAAYPLTSDESAFWLGTGALVPLDGILVRVDSDPPDLGENEVLVEIQPEVLRLITQRLHPELATD